MSLDAVSAATPIDQQRPAITLSLASLPAGGQLELDTPVDDAALSTPNGRWMSDAPALPDSPRTAPGTASVVTELRGYSSILPTVAVIPLPGALVGGLATLGLIGLGYVVSVGKRRSR